MEPLHKTLWEYPSSLAGNEAITLGVVNHCDQQFLDAIIVELESYASLTVAEKFRSLTIYGFDDDNVPSGAVFALKRLDEMISQCQRLQATPQVFPSNESMEKFARSVGNLGTLLHAADKATADFVNNTRKHPSNLGPGPIKLDSSATVFTFPALAQGLLSQVFSKEADGKNPWNKWLDNSAVALPGWAALEQKIPLMGDRLIRQITKLYDEVENDFIEDGLVLEHHEDTHPIAGPGDAYKHMTWSGFLTVPLSDPGKQIGGNKIANSHNVQTIEDHSQFLSKWMCNRIPFQDLNFPFFRFAMGYRVN